MNSPSFRHFQPPQLLRWEQLSKAVTPFQSPDWYRSAGVADRTVLFHAGTPPQDAVLVARRTVDTEHYYHSLRTLICGMRETPFLQQAGLDIGALRAAPWGEGIVTVSPFGYRGGAIAKETASTTVRQLADDLLQFARNTKVRWLLSHYLFEPEDSAWIHALIEKRGIGLILGAHCVLDLESDSIDAYFRRLGSSRRSLRANSAWGTNYKDVDWIIQERPGLGRHQAECPRLWSEFSERFDSVHPPWMLFADLANGHSFDRVLFSVNEPSGRARSALVALRQNSTLYPKYFGTDVQRKDYLPLVYNRLIQYAISNGFRRIDYGGGAHQTKLFRGAQLRWALGVVILLDPELRSIVGEACTALSVMKARHFQEMSRTWHVNHEAPTLPSCV